MINNDMDLDLFMHNSPFPIISGSLSQSNPFNPFHDNFFFISTFNVNGLATAPSVSFKELYNLFFINHIAICDVVVTHLSPKLMKYHSSLMLNYLGFHSVIDPLASACSFGGVLLFLHSSFAAYVQSYTFHSSYLLTVNLYFQKFY